MQKLKFRLKRPTKRGVIQFIYYNLGGVAFFLSGYLVFVLLYGVLHWWWWVAKGIADLVGWGLNYLIQRYLAFNEESKQQSQRKLISKYVGFSLLNVLIDYALVAGLYFLGVSPFLGLWISSIFFTIWKYLWYKFWVFKNKPAKK
ncbi:MAG: GtrA family protein [Candidatus Saccharimonadales bacterium]